MSNEYKDYIYDKVQDILLETYVVDKVTHVKPSNSSYMVEGLKNGDKVKFEVWFDDEEGWKFERREL